jgi:hypothetical protein
MRFKAFSNRRKDWAEIEEMLRADRLDVPYVIGILNEYLGPDDERIRELLTIRDEIRASAAAVDRHLDRP